MNKYIDIYDDKEIKVSFFIEINENGVERKHIAMKYLKPKDYIDKNGKNISTTNIMNGETEYFILPHSFGILIGRKLFEQYSLGLEGFNKDGIKSLIDWLLEYEIIEDCMCY